MYRRPAVSMNGANKTHPSITDALEATESAVRMVIYCASIIIFGEMVLDSVNTSRNSTTRSP